MLKIADSLPPRRRLFVVEYLKDLNATAAARRAGYSDANPGQEGGRLLQDPDVQAAIKEAMDERAKAVGIEAEDVLRALVDVAMADPNEVVQFRRTCCRHCWGEAFGYQRTAGEMKRDRAQHVADMRRKQQDADRDNKAFEPTTFDEAGGEGYDARREPNELCPECFGEGHGDVFAQDTRLLTGAARRLYAGVKRTKDGFEVKMRDQDKAVELLGRHLGMFVDKVELSNPDGSLTLTPDERAAKLAALVEAAKQRKDLV